MSEFRPVYISESNPDSSNLNLPVLLLVPHASKFDPSGTLPSGKLSTHNGYDIGAWELSTYLHLTLNVPRVAGGVTRLLAEQNRCYPREFRPFAMRQEEHDRWLELCYEPYVNAVYEKIRSFHAGKQGVILFDLHTYTRLLKPKETRRKPFAVQGDAKSSLVTVLMWQLEKKFFAPETQQKIRQDLRLMGRLSEADLTTPVALNWPYNMEPGGEFFRTLMMSKYEEDFGLFSWVALETRNDLARNKNFQQIVADAFRATLADPRVIAEFEFNQHTFLKPRRVISVPRASPTSYSPERST